MLIVITKAKLSHAGGKVYSVNYWSVYHATAAQRAEAFVLIMTTKETK